jgi:hypothetical protein
MKTFLIAILATLALATSAMAKIGETKQQVIQRSQRNKDVISIKADDSLGKPALKVLFKDGAEMTHIFGRSGREIMQFTYSPKQWTADDVVQTQQLYPTRWYGTSTENGLFSWQSKSGLMMTAKRYSEYDFLSISDLTKLNEIAVVAKAILSTAPVSEPAEPTSPNKPAVTTEEKDCLVVAAEIQARLKKTSCWSRIAAFTWKDEEEIIGHAAVFYQPDEGANVFMYDKMLGQLICRLSHTT